MFAVGEIFSGPGGMALGAKLAAEDIGVELHQAWAVDSDENTCRTFRKNITGDKNGRVIVADVRDVDFSKLSPIEGFAFGFPCNDFSLVGNHKGLQGSFGPLYKEGIRAINEHEPLFFVAENVGGIRSSDEGRTFRQILQDMNFAGSNGYEVVPHYYKFEEYGVPQARHRVVVVGIRKDLGKSFKVPSPAPYIDSDVSARTCLNIPPIAETATNHEFPSQSERVRSRLDHIQPGKNAFNSDLPPELRLNVNGATLSQIYKRLDPAKPSYTVTGSGGGGTHMYHWDQPRALTNRERARLQTFPDSFEFVGGRESVRKQIGMAVPVQGARVVFQAIFKTMLGQDYQSVSPNLDKYMGGPNDKDQLQFDFSPEQ